MSTDRGYLIMPRNEFEHACLNPAGRPFHRRAAWQWLIHNAAFQDGTISTNGQTVTVARGQLYHSTRYLGEKWHWDEKQVRRFLKILEKERFLVTETAAGRTLITIVDYNRFSNLKEAVSAAMPQDCRKSAAKEKEGNQGNQCKEEEHPSDACARTRRKRPNFAQPDLLRPTADVHELPITDDPRTAMEMWNAAAIQYGLPTVTLKADLATYRENRTRLVQLLAECGGLLGWQAALDRIPINPHFVGVNDTGWKCSLKYLLKPGNIDKLGHAGAKAAYKPPRKSTGADLSYLYTQPLGTFEAENGPGPDDGLGPIIDMPHEEYA